MDSEGPPVPDANIANSMNAVKVILFIYYKYEMFHTVFQE